MATNTPGEFNEVSLQKRPGLVLSMEDNAKQRNELTV